MKLRRFAPSLVVWFCSWVLVLSCCCRRSAFGFPVVVLVSSWFLFVAVGVFSGTFVGLDHRFFVLVSLCFLVVGVLSVFVFLGRRPGVCVSTSSSVVCPFRCRRVSCRRRPGQPSGSSSAQPHPSQNLNLNLNFRQLGQPPAQQSHTTPNQSPPTQPTTPTQHAPKGPTTPSTAHKQPQTQLEPSTQPQPTQPTTH